MCIRDRFKTPVYATHIECPEVHMVALDDWLHKIYSSASNPTVDQMPLGIFFRRVPVAKHLMSVSSLDKVAQLAARQENFCDALIRVTTREIVSLDTSDPHTGRSLRSILMELKTSQGASSLRLFHSINPTYHGDC